MRILTAWLALGTLFGSVGAAPPVGAQSPGVVIEENNTDDGYAPLLERAKELREQGTAGWLDAAAVRRLMKAPTPRAIELPAPLRQTRLSRTELAYRARKALVRVGWLYRHDPQDEWQLDLAGGYAIAAGGVLATCRHVIDPDYPEPLAEGFLIAADAEGAVAPIAGLLAVDEEMDTALIQVNGLKTTPLPLSVHAAPGDAAFVFSDPMGVEGYFSEGMINRFYWFDPLAGKDRNMLAGMRNLRIHLSTDWAPGSSGAAVLDKYGNALGHVAEIESLLDDPGEQDGVPEPPAAAPAASEQPSGDHASDDAETDSHEKDADAGADPHAEESATMMVLHCAIPARAVKMLAESCDPKHNE